MKQRLLIQFNSIHLYWNTLCFSYWRKKTILRNEIKGRAGFTKGQDGQLTGLVTLEKAEKLQKRN